MAAVTDGADAISANTAALPQGIQVAGYATGPGIAWTAGQWAEHPSALRIDQDPGAVVPTADVLDVENGAATYADCSRWAHNALRSFSLAARPGQRSPAVYASKGNLTPVVNALIAGGITSGIGLWVADWTYSRDAAVAMLAASGGPFPVIGVQYSDQGGGGKYDLDVFLTSWLENVSAPPVPPGQWNDPAAWTWAIAVLAGTGLDGNAHAFTFTGTSWIKTK